VPLVAQRDATRRYLASRDARDVVLDGHPTKLTIELTSHCQLRCPSCPRETAHRDLLQRRNMDYSLFEQLAVKHVPQLEYLSLAGGLGEPLLYPRFVDAVRLARGLNKDCEISISTNGLVRTALDQLIAVDGALSFVQISIDGVGEMFDAMVGRPRVWARFDRMVAEMLPLLSSVGTAVRFNSVVRPHNVAQVPAIVAKVAMWGGTRLYFNGMNLVATDLPRETYDFYWSEEFLSAMDEAAELGEQRGVDVGWFDMREIVGFRSCEYPWDNFYISWDGTLVPCCAKPFAQLLNFGSALRPSWWNDNGLVQFRRLSNRNVSPRFCDGCHLQCGPAVPARGASRRVLPVQAAVQDPHKGHRAAGEHPS